MKFYVLMYVSFISWRIARQRLAKHVPEFYSVNENRRPLLDNGCGYHGFTVADMNSSNGTLGGVISVKFSGIL
jgi:hypothetical protein